MLVCPDHPEYEEEPTKHREGGITATLATGAYNDLWFDIWPFAACRCVMNSLTAGSGPLLVLKKDISQINMAFKNTFNLNLLNLVPQTQMTVFPTQLYYQNKPIQKETRTKLELTLQVFMFFFFFIQ